MLFRSPIAGNVLPRLSWIAPNAAVVVRAPAQQPKFIAGRNLNTFAPISNPNNNGIVVAKTPAMNSMKPASRIPDRNVGPAVIPITAMNIFKPKLLNIQTAGSGTRPKVGCLVRNQPKNNPESRAPPLVDRKSVV